MMLLSRKNSSSEKIGHSGPNLAAKLTDPCNTGSPLMIFSKIFHNERKRDQENHIHFAKSKKNST